MREVRDLRMMPKKPNITSKRVSVRLLFMDGGKKMSPTRNKHWVKCLVCLSAALWALDLWAGAGVAQGRGLMELPPELPPELPAPVQERTPPVQEKAPRPEKGPESVGALVDSLSSTDSVFEVVVG